MNTVTSKRKGLGVKGKVIREIENWKKKAVLCREFGLVSSTIQTIWKKGAKIISVLDQSGVRTKRIRKPERSTA